MSGFRTFSRDEFADALGLSDRLKSVGASDYLAPWGVARLIRREVRRRAIVTRRELRNTLEPYFKAASFEGDAKTAIQKIAGRMVEVGELADLKVENQRGYSAMPSRWIQLHENDAVLLGTTATETHRFYPLHPNQFLRRFPPSENIVADLSRIGVIEQSLHDWLGSPGWKLFVERGHPIDTLDGLLDCYINRLDSDGSPLRPESTSILAVDHRPGDFFGSERKSKNSRWVPCNQLDDGIYIGAQPGQNENHWIPLLIRIHGSGGRSLELHHRNDVTANNDLRNWLLVALGARNQRKEAIVLDQDASHVHCTFPMPTAIRRILRLIGEPTGDWQRYVVLNPTATGDLLRRCIPEVDVH